MSTVRVFYSWQADLSEVTTRSFIAECLDQAAKELASKGGIAVQASPDRKPALARRAATAILKMIDSCDLFACDLSFRGSSDVALAVPNAQVLFELGYAVKTLGWHKVICIVNEAFGNAEALPLYVADDRLCRYCLYDNQDSSEQRALLVGQLKDAMSTPREGVVVSPGHPLQAPHIHDDFSPPRNLRVMLVEDEHVLRTKMKHMLRRLGYSDVVEATDGAQALKVLAISHPNIVITGWSMPKMTGLELATHIRQQDPTLPIIMTTTNSDKASVVDAIKAGVNYFLVKPVEQELLAAKMKKLVKEMEASC